MHISGHHRDIHSFPTRRSSDLSPMSVSVPFTPDNTHGRGAEGAVRQAPTRARSIAPRYSDARRLHGDRSAPARSEEHTSELQSRFELVCRLLLEKKTIPIPAER